LNVGEHIRVAVNGYQMFAQVRRCDPAESGFIIGVERIDDWDKPPAESELASPGTAKTAQSEVLGRPKLKQPLDNLRGAALRAVFADPRLRTPEKNYRTAFIAVVCVAFAGFAGLGGWSVYSHKGPSAPSIKTVTPNPLPRPLDAVDATPLNTDTANTASSSSTKVAAPPVQKVRVEVPEDQTTRTAATPKLKARPATGPLSRISIKLTDASWVTACADGARVIDTLLDKGYAGEIPFSRGATIRFGNAGAIELAVGDQPATTVGPSGEARMIKATPAGYKLIKLSSVLNCPN
ncbi:MAG: DUF4115 domain-containing protein, partial [Acidobacteriota bacterium]